MAITNLNQYYQSIGKPLPSLSARAGLYSQYGLGGRYVGSASQNTALLQKLLGGGTPGSSPAAPSTPAPAPAAPATGGIGQPIKAITSQDIQNAQSQAAQEFAPAKQALTTDLSAKLRQNLAASQNQIQQDLASRGFTRSGEEPTSLQLANITAQSDLALQEAGYLQNIDTEQQNYAQTLLQNQVNNLGLNADQIGQQLQIATSEGDLLMNPNFTLLLSQYPDLAKQLLTTYGFTVQ